MRNKKISDMLIITKQLKLTESEQEIILNGCVCKLHELIVIKKEFSCMDVLLTFYKRALTLGHQLQLLADINLKNSLTKAKECD